MQSAPYTVLAYYSYQTIADPQHEVALHKAFLKIRISPPEFTFPKRDKRSNVRRSSRC